MQNSLLLGCANRRSVRRMTWAVASRSLDGPAPSFWALPHRASDATGVGDEGTLGSSMCSLGAGLREDRVMTPQGTGRWARMWSFRQRARSGGNGAERDAML